MPGGDGTGPMGMGPMTGRGAGYCAGYNMPGFAQGRGFWRRGFGRGFGWRRWARAAPVGPVWEPYPQQPYPQQLYAQQTKEQEIQFLEQEAKAVEEEQKALSQELEDIRKRIEELKK